VWPAPLDLPLFHVGPPDFPSLELNMLSLRKTFTATALALALGGALPAVLSTAEAAGTLNVAINRTRAAGTRSTPS